MRQQHVEMPLVHRHVGRLAHRAARMVQPLRRVGELHEVAEILDRRIAPAVLVVPHERRPVDRRQHQVAPADRHVALRIPRPLHVFARRGRTQPPRQPLRQMHPVAAHVGTGVLPEREGGRVLGEAHADLLQHRLGVRLDQRQPFLVEDLVVRDAPPDERRRLDVHRRPLGPPRRSATGAPGPATCCRDFAHLDPPSAPVSVLPPAGGFGPVVSATAQAFRDMPDAAITSPPARGSATPPPRRRSAP